MSDANSNPPAGRGASVWIWAGAVAVAVLALAGGGYWWLSEGQRAGLAGKRPNLIGDLGGTVTQLDNTRPDMDKMCALTLARALDFGVLPPGSTLTSNDAQESQTEGRYSCQAQGAGGKFTLVVDTTCPGSQEKSCFALQSVRSEDGKVIYQRL